MQLCILIEQNNKSVLQNQYYQATIILRFVIASSRPLAPLQ